MTTNNNKLPFGSYILVWNEYSTVQTINHRFVGQKCLYREPCVSICWYMCRWTAQFGTSLMSFANLYRREKKTKLSEKKLIQYRQIQESVFFIGCLCKQLETNKHHCASLDQTPLDEDSFSWLRPMLMPFHVRWRCSLWWWKSCF